MNPPQSIRVIKRKEALLSAAEFHLLITVVGKKCGVNALRELQTGENRRAA